MRIILAAFTLLAPPAYAELQWSFADVSFNRLDWDRGTEAKSPKRDFSYLELEGGGQFNWGELYGFFDIENPGKGGHDTRTAGKGSVNYYLFGSKASLYGHVYNFAADGFSEQNRVMGLGYTFIEKAWWFKPFIGFHEVSQTFYSGSNGYMLGWVFGRLFTIKGRNFLLADWHEHEFGRNERYARGNGGKRTSHNGALSVWWIPSKHLTGGVQWRYAADKLGTGGPINAFIYTVKYVF
jgi:hypothetical protein